VAPFSLFIFDVKILFYVGEMEEFIVSVCKINVPGGEYVF
jgi:hypothetical protein